MQFSLAMPVDEKVALKFYQKVKENQNQTMMDKIPLELQIKGLEKNMGTIVKALKDIKAWKKR